MNSCGDESSLFLLCWLIYRTCYIRSSWSLRNNKQSHGSASSNSSLECDSSSRNSRTNPQPHPPPLRLISEMKQSVALKISFTINYPSILVCQRRTSKTTSLYPPPPSGRNFAFTRTFRGATGAAAAIEMQMKRRRTTLPEARFAAANTTHSRLSRR